MWHHFAKQCELYCLWNDHFERRTVSQQICWKIFLHNIGLNFRNATYLTWVPLLPNGATHLLPKADILLNRSLSKCQNAIISYKKKWKKSVGLPLTKKINSESMRELIKNWCKIYWGTGFSKILPILCFIKEKVTATNSSDSWPVVIVFLSSLASLLSILELIHSEWLKWL